MTGRKRFKCRLTFFQESGADVLAVRRNQIAPSARPYRGVTPFDGGVTFRVSEPFAAGIRVYECPRDMRVKEASVKKLKYFSLAVLVLSLLAIPATAQKGKDHDNKGAANEGDPRADLVKSTNKTPSKGKDNDKNDTKGKRKGFTQGKHKSRH
jgi:hypothetical protein